MTTLSACSYISLSFPPCCRSWWSLLLGLKGYSSLGSLHWTQGGLGALSLFPQTPGLFCHILIFSLGCEQFEGSLESLCNSHSQHILVWLVSSEGPCEWRGWGWSAEDRFWRDFLNLCRDLDFVLKEKGRDRKDFKQAKCHCLRDKVVLLNEQEKEYSMRFRKSAHTGTF